MERHDVLAAGRVWIHQDRWPAELRDDHITEVRCHHQAGTADRLTAGSIADGVCRKVSINHVDDGPHRGSRGLAECLRQR